MHGAFWIVDEARPGMRGERKIGRKTGRHTNKIAIHRFERRATSAIGTESGDANAAHAALTERFPDHSASLDPNLSPSRCRGKGAAGWILSQVDDCGNRHIRLKKIESNAVSRIICRQHDRTISGAHPVKADQPLCG
jgi:hypothetical protein